MHDELYELKEKLLKELKEYSQNNKFSKEDTEVMKYLSSTIDHICNIVMDMEEESGSYARGGSYRGGSYAREGEMGGNRGGNMGGGSYARGRGRNARRDSMGRYSSENRRYSREGGYSRDDGREEMIEDLEGLMQDAPNAMIREEIEKLIRNIENA